jgi:hypothetical protein
MDPVGTGLPAPPLTATFTEIASAFVTPEEGAVTVTVGVVCDELMLQPVAVLTSWD